jgi:hypothetical protein
VQERPIFQHVFRTSRQQGQITRGKSALMKQLVRQLHSRKGQDTTLPASLWMRYKAVEQKNAQLCRPGIPLRRQVSSP